MSDEVIEAREVWWQGRCSCGEWVSRKRPDRKSVDAEADLHDDAPFAEHVVQIKRYAR